MKKTMLFLLALLLIALPALAEADETTNSFKPKKPVVFSFAGNSTTGYEWVCSLKNDGVVKLTESVYVENEHEEGVIGFGGAYNFTFEALAPGEAVAEFFCGRAWETESAETIVYLLTVAEDGAISVRPLEGIAPITGKVTGFEDGAALVTTENNGVMLCRFPEGTETPVMDEEVIIWFNGVTTMSIPAQLNVLAWETVAPEKAK